MAVQKVLENTILSLKQQIGTMSSGKPRYKTYSYSSIDVAAADADVYAVGSQLATLFAENIEKITRQDIGSLTDDMQP